MDDEKTHGPRWWPYTVSADTPPSSAVRVGLEIFRLALVDFGEWADDTERFTYRPNARASLALDAGLFLLERDDAITRFWFAVCGQDVARFRSRVARTRPHWYERLGALKRAKEMGGLRAEHRYSRPSDAARLVSGVRRFGKEGRARKAESGHHQRQPALEVVA